jgi:hypothetical protein
VENRTLGAGVKGRRRETIMTAAVAEWIVLAFGIYAVLGVAFAVPFALVGARRIDPVAAEGTWGFRILVVPGAAALWPYLALRWMKAPQPPIERSPHRDAARTEAS